MRVLHVRHDDTVTECWCVSKLLFNYRQDLEESVLKWVTLLRNFSHLVKLYFDYGYDDILSQEEWDRLCRQAVASIGLEEE